MVLVLDNFDSFTYNLVQYIGTVDSNIRVVRNNSSSVTELLSMEPSHIVVSPGPCTPKEAGISMELILATPAQIPLLGVCLGHQCLGAAFGAVVKRAPYVMHGKVSKINYTYSTLFEGMFNPFTATRYHSLVVDPETIGQELEITAFTDDGIIMGLQHKSKPLFGVQFHPESIKTEEGMILIRNFLALGG